MKWDKLSWVALLALFVLEAKVRSHETEAPAPAEQGLQSDSLLLLCTADGSIFVLNAWTGKLQSTSRTGIPLLTRSVAESMAGHSGEDGDDDSVILANHIVPGLDGKLYWQENDVDEETSEEEENLPLQPLPLSIPSLLAHPVRTCSENQEACGILHAVEHTALYGLHPRSGELRWSTRSVLGMGEDDSESSSDSYLILQRKDVSIQQISSRSGKQLWNITMGTYQAVDFDGGVHSSTSSKSSSLLDDDDDLENNEDPNAQEVSLLPSLAFAEGGRQLVAVRRNTEGMNEFGPILWRIEAPTRVASIFGIREGEWHPINIIDDFYEHFSTRQTQLLLADSPANEATTDWLDEWMREEMYQMHRRHFGGENFFRPDVVQGLLPAPEDMEKQISTRGKMRLELPDSPVTVVPPYGLVLSWEFVSAVTLSVMIISCSGVFMYRRQKQLLRRAQIRVNLAETARRNPPAESQSLPGEIRNMPGGSKPTHSDPGEKIFADVAALTKTNGSSASDENVQQGVIQQGGIPLVRYARFRSEFEEMQALGKGGFGSVFRCRNNLDGREYALKKVSIRRKREDDAAFQQRLQRFLREVKILAVLDHPNIVRYYTAWLEVEDGPEEDDEHNEDERTVSRCYSSSYLTERTVTEWGKGKNKNDLSKRDRWGPDSETNSSLGNGLFLPRIPAHRPLDPSEDLGFIFEGSEEQDGAEPMFQRRHSASRGVEPSESDSATNGNQPDEQATDDPAIGLRHTLYIQMQLCSFDNLSDFVADPNARRGSLSMGVDVSLALRLFLQVAQAVQYVHGKGLIHRDLKPTNCFVDEAGRIKVGDFGLSRESSDKDGTDLSEVPSDPMNDEQTAGVGTRLYASPEQSAGSLYDSSTDVFSLGIILFELCYPMYTGMERNICISRLRDNLDFPPDWDASVAKAFPTLRDLIVSMLAKNGEQRPKAEEVAHHVQDLLGELTIISVTKDQTADKDLILLRVEADSEADTLPTTMDEIRQAAQPGSVDILQYGMSQTKDSHIIMEFALRSSPGVDGGNLVLKLKQRPKILMARQVSVPQ